MKLTKRAERLLKSNLLSSLAKSILMCLLRRDSTVDMLSDELMVGPDTIKEGLLELARLRVIKPSDLNPIPIGRAKAKRPRADQAV